MRRIAAREYASLTVILVVAAAVALFWAIRVPFYQAPDELAHADYAFELYDAGTPFVVRGGRPAIEVAPQTRYLMDAVGYRRMRYSTTALPAAGYGTHAYFRDVDARAPQPSGHVPANGDPVPYMMLTYPFTYYAAATAVLAGAERLTHSLVFGFFAMRVLGIAAECLTLVFGFLALRRFGVGPADAALVTLAAGLFPLTTAISSSIQPDTFVLAFFAIALYGAALVRIREARGRAYAWLGIALVGLAMTKQHYALAAWIATVPLVAATARTARERLASAAVLLVPVAAFAFAYTSFGPVHGVESIVHFASRTHAANAATATSHAGPSAAQIAADTLRSAVDGTIAQTFWLRFGYRAGHIFPGDFAASVAAFVDVVCFVVFALVEVVLLKRIARVARARSVASALGLLARGYGVNVFLATSALLLLATIASGGALELQGRYWLPTLFALVLFAVRTVPRAFAPRARHASARAFSGVIAAYALVACASAAVAMNAYYYSPHAGNGYASVAELRSPETLALPHPADVPVVGSAIDTTTGLPAARVYALVDGAHAVEATTGLPSPKLAVIFNDSRVARAGFRIVLPARLLGPGTHAATFYIGRPGDTRSRIRGGVSIAVR